MADSNQHHLIQPKCESESAVSSSATGAPASGEQDGSISDSVKLMADKHATIRSHLVQAQLELQNRLEANRALEDKIRVGCSQISIAEQKLHNLNETLHYETEALRNLERLHEELVMESVELDEKILRETQMLKTVEAKENADKIVMDEHKNKVVKVEGETESGINREERLRQLEEEYKKLLELEERVKNGDPELKKIISGQALKIVDVQKIAIMEAYSEQQMELEQLRNQLSEKLQEIANVEQLLKVDEKQNQARLLRMQKQLAELEETERHLKKTALHLQSQRDFGME